MAMTSWASSTLPLAQLQSVGYSNLLTNVWLSLCVTQIKPFVKLVSYLVFLCTIYVDLMYLVRRERYDARCGTHRCQRLSDCP